MTHNLDYITIYWTFALEGFPVLRLSSDLWFHKDQLFINAATVWAKEQKILNQEKNYSNKIDGKGKALMLQQLPPEQTSNQPL